MLVKTYFLNLPCIRIPLANSLVIVTAAKQRDQGWGLGGWRVLGLVLTLKPLRNLIPGKSLIDLGLELQHL